MTLEQLVKQLPVWVGQAENNWKENKDCSFVSIFVMVMQKAHNSTLGYGRVSVNILGGGGKRKEIGNDSCTKCSKFLNVCWTLMVPKFYLVPVKDSLEHFEIRYFVAHA